ncbi:MAG: hypothetical protein ABJK59_11750 [Erythrobacter sp.]|uniref:hypothetical protein n=1 Tax=Erythrobacter sp. TaxID=1042 RepID=UPI00329A607D
MNSEIALFLIGLLVWSLIVSVCWDYLLRRFVVRMEEGALRSAIIIGILIAISFAGHAWVDATGWDIKSGLGHIGGYILLSPIGLPLWLGIPFLIIKHIVDQSSAWRIENYR